MFWLFHIHGSRTHWQQWLPYCYHPSVMFPKIHGADSPAGRTLHFRVTKAQKGCLRAPAFMTRGTRWTWAVGTAIPSLHHPFSRFAAILVETAWLLLSSRKAVLDTRPSITAQPGSSWGCTVVKLHGQENKLFHFRSLKCICDVGTKASSVLETICCFSARGGARAAFCHRDGQDSCSLSALSSGWSRWPFWLGGPVPFPASGLCL